MVVQFLVHQESTILWFQDVSRGYEKPSKLSGDQSEDLGRSKSCTDRTSFETKTMPRSIGWRLGAISHLKVEGKSSLQAQLFDFCWGAIQLNAESTASTDMFRLFRFCFGLRRVWYGYPPWRSWMVLVMVASVPLWVLPWSKQFASLPNVHQFELS